MNGRLLVLSVALACGGCASAGPPDGDGDAALDGGSQATAVEMIVINRTSRAVTVFIEWQSGARSRLGEVPRRETVAFVTPYRDSDVRLSLDVVSSTPPVGTTSDPRVFSGRSTPGNRGADRAQHPYVTIYPGDRFEWEIRTVVPTVDMYYRRLTPG